MKYSETKSLLSSPPIQVPKEFAYRCMGALMCVCMYVNVHCASSVREEQGMWREAQRKMLTDTYREGVQAVFKVLTVSVTVCHNKPIEAAPLCLPLTEYCVCRRAEKNLCLTGRQRKMDSELTRNRKHWGKHPYQGQWKCQIKKGGYDEKIGRGTKFITISEIKCWWQPSDRCWLTFQPCQPGSSRSSDDNRAHLCQQSSARAYFMMGSFAGANMPQSYEIPQRQGQRAGQCISIWHRSKKNRYQGAAHFHLRVTKLFDVYKNLNPKIFCFIFVASLKKHATNFTCQSCTVENVGTTVVRAWPALAVKGWYYIC